MKTNWSKGHMNLFLGVECYKGSDGNWWTRNIRTKIVSGPYKTLREAKIGSYEVVA